MLRDLQILHFRNISYLFKNSFIDLHSLQKLVSQSQILSLIHSHFSRLQSPSPTGNACHVVYVGQACHASHVEYAGYAGNASNACHAGLAGHVGHVEYAGHSSHVTFRSFSCYD